MKTDEQSQVVLIFGRKGTGKTRLMKRSLKKISGKKTILIIDIIDKYRDDCDITFITARECYRFLMSDESQNKKVRLNSHDQNQIQAALIGAYYRGNVTIFMDEADSIFGRNTNNFIKEIILRGRNQGIDLVLSSLRPYKLNVDVRNQADIIYCFRVVSKQFLKSIVQEFGEIELYDCVNNLQGQHDYVRYDVNGSKIQIFKDGKKPKKKAS